MISIPSPPDEDLLMPLDPRTPPVAGPAEAPADRPTWTQLPANTRQEVIRLLAQMLLARAARAPLARPARGGDHERRQ
jgi:hypothetical protein